MINRWLEGVETAKNERTLHGREEDKSVSKNKLIYIHAVYKITDCKAGKNDACFETNINSKYWHPLIFYTLKESSMFLFHISTFISNLYNVIFTECNLSIED